jgi:2-phosphosulfolactate phosphatase
VNLEDTIFAGAVVANMLDKGNIECDAALMAYDLYKAAQSDLTGFLKNSSHYKRLSRLHFEEDMQFCMSLNRYKTVPVLRESEMISWKD